MAATVPTCTGENSGSGIEITLADQIDLEHVAGWLAHCDTKHGAVCSGVRYAADAASDAELLLVDVVAGCVIQTTQKERFIALSYVWGGIDQLRLLTSNFADLSHPGSLQRESVRQLLPGTIRDAMTVVRGLRERYLWVDTLCIIQDDNSYKQKQVGKMASIYDSAIVTLVACTAQDADHPLPGVSPQTRMPKLLDVRGFSDSNLAFVDQPVVFIGAVLARSPHNNRAWTFQEVVLSKRCLFFFGSQLYFQCQKSQRKEGSLEEIPHGPMNHAGNWPPLEQSFPGRIYRYSEMVHDFTRRNLTFPEDRLNAFSGLLTALKKTWQWTFVFALPVQSIDWALLWVPEDGRAIDTAGKEVSAPAADFLFPSWAWLSHRGPSYYFLEVHSDALHSNVLKSHIDWPSAMIWHGQRARALRNIGISEAPGDNDGKHDPMESLYSNYPEGTMTFPAYVTVMDNIGVAEPSSGLGNFEKKRQEFLLAGNVYTPLFNSKGNWYGTLVGISESHLGALIECKDAECSLVLLSSASKTWVMGGFRRPIPCFDTDVFIDESWCTVNVMLVRSDKRPYRRLAIGEVHRDEWRKLAPQGDLIWLA